MLGIMDRFVNLDNDLKVEYYVGSVEQRVKSEKGEGPTETYESRYWRFERRAFVEAKRGIDVKTRCYFYTEKKIYFCDLTSSS